ncbi:hypothetical protein [Pseudonocardia zijingensis]|uniref:Uncharacterized protein n=1 Tax=Pseudonocardia zijingensis TaxID=153376 RepID=A0ABP3YZ63_9PSEU
MTTRARPEDILDVVEVAAHTQTAPETRIWQRSGTRAWVLVGERRGDSALHRPPLDRVVGTTSHRSTRRRPVGSRHRARAERPGWLWVLRWYRARWAARRTLRTR